MSKQYAIYHAVTMGDQLCPLVIQAREYIATILADNLDKAFELSNNTRYNWHPSARSRSTSIGDVILDVETGEPYLMMPMGFTGIDVQDIGLQEDDREPDEKTGE